MTYESGVGEIWPQAAGMQQTAVGPSAEVLETFCTEQSRKNESLKRTFKS